MTNSIKYLPFMTGTYTVAPGLKRTDSLAQKEDRLIFKIDTTYDHYLANKQQCRRENIHKYYLSKGLPLSTIRAVNKFIYRKLTKEYPSQFIPTNEERLLNALSCEEIVIKRDWVNTANETYLTLFDALCNQVQEDLAVFQLTEHSDYLAAIHLCSPNHWSPAEKIGKSYDEIHKPVAEMGSTLKGYPKMLKALVRSKQAFTRFAWGVSTDDRLNHHPHPPPLCDPLTWQGRILSSNTSPLFVRVERQNLISLAEVNAFLFTIRTYFYNINTFMPAEKNALWNALRSMSPASLKYKGLDVLLPELENRLK